MSRKFVPFDVWAVYENPSDYPGKYVARRHEITTPDDKATSRPTAEVIVCDALADIRAAMNELGLVRIGRFADDDPVILETWI